MRFLQDRLLLYLNITVLLLAKVLLLSSVWQYNETRVNVAIKQKERYVSLCTNKAWLIWVNKVLPETLRQL